MRGTDIAVLEAASDGGVVVERYTGKARWRVTGKALSPAAVTRAVRDGDIRRTAGLSLDFHYVITEYGTAALSLGQPAAGVR